MESDTVNKDPPWNGSNRTKFKTFKVPLKSVIKDQNGIPLIENVVFKANDLTFHTYQLIKAYILYNFDREEPVFVEITDQFIGYCMRALGFCSRIGRPKNDEELYQDIKSYYENHYQPSIGHALVDMNNFSKIRANLVVQIKTMISNNIKLRFIQHFRRFINKVTYDKENPIEDKVLRKLKADLLNQRYGEIDDRFTDLIDFVISFVPKDTTKSLEYDVEDDDRTLLYLKGMLLMNRELERGGHRCFRELPLRDKNVPQNVMLDTSSLIDSLVTVDGITKTEVFNSINKYKDDIWEEVLNMKHSVFKSTRYKFYHQITTDGVSCSLLFVDKSKTHTRGQKSDPNPSEFIFPNLTDQADLNKLEHRIVGCDPGKRSLVYMWNGEKALRYTNPQRRVEGGMKKGAFSIMRLRKAPNTIEDKSVEEFESTLSSRTANTTYHEKFLEYCRAKTQARNTTMEFYRQPVFRRIRLRTFISTKRSVDKFIHRIGQTFGQDCVIAYGNWSRTTQMKGCIPSPGIGLRRLIHRKFRTVTTDEYLTTKLCNGCGNRMKNHTVPSTAKKHQRTGRVKVHRLMCCSECVSSESKHVAFRSRDLNAAKNIYDIGVHCCQTTGGRHPWFSRPSKT
jgi:hypothetical protein